MYREKRVNDRNRGVERSVAIVKRIERELNERGVDLYLIVSREDCDPLASMILDTHVVAQTAFFFRANGEHIVLTGRTDAMAYELYPFFHKIIAMEEGFAEEFSRVFEPIDPNRVALNICEEDPSFDGLRWGLYEQLETIIGSERLAKLEVSGADIVRNAIA